MFSHLLKCNKKQFTLRIISVMILCVAVFVGIKAYMFKSVKNVEEDFYAIVHNQENADTDYGMLLHYDYSEYGGIESVYEYEFDIEDVWHNTKNGQMKVKYYFSAKVADGERPTMGSGNSSRWYIEKRDKRWVVVKIEEPFGAATRIWTPEGYDISDETFY